MRLDQELVIRGLARSRTQAARLVAEGRVKVSGVIARKPAMSVDTETDISADTEKWVSRAAHKLLGAIEESGTSMEGRVLDAGASTGGFTQVVLAQGAKLVYAVDVGHHQLADPIRSDPRVRVREGLNLRVTSPWAIWMMSVSMSWLGTSLSSRSRFCCHRFSGFFIPRGLRFCW